MTLENIEKTRPSKLTIQEAAAIMGVAPMFLRLALRQQRFEFGTAIESGKWVYYINTERFIRYMKGHDMNVSS